MKKVLIFYASYGGGHLSAANAINEYIKNNYPNIETEIIDCMKYVNKRLEKLTTVAYKEMAKKAPWAWGTIYYTSQHGLVAELSSTSNKILARKLNTLLQEYMPDLIISTHPFASQMCSYLKKHNKINCKIASIMTDFAPHDQWLVGKKCIDYFFVAHNKMKEDLIKKKVPAEKIFATGIPLSNKFLLNFDRTEILKQFGLKENKKTILFFGGGEFGLGKTKTLKVLSSLLNDFDNIQIVAISGKNVKMKNKFQELADNSSMSEDIKIMEYTNNVPELMSVSDLVVTKPGGLTTSESLASGLPIIVINPIPGQEFQNAEFLEEKGVGIWIKSSTNINETLHSLLNNPEKFKQMKVNAKLLAKKYSTRDICKILLEK